LTCGIVIAGNNKDPDSCFFQPAHTAGKEKTGILILPVAVIEVACNQDKINLFLDGKVNQVIKGPPRCAANFINRSVLMGPPSLLKGCQCGCRQCG